ncbi:TIGR03936 family radical SAM-associated protein [Clostridium minihomine]|uniref:TIGR03936 family radical SAM-associated protein n=1 Tax=Clostridium minihomine TaxID=2045012 RepID=UPI0013EA3BCD|nr:TIGR03936 family radical SAM-associated protein [Clostridium minihomine]
MRTVRIWFHKKGTAKYISHLDLNRCISQAFHKAKVPLWYTQGFHPYAFLTFALPLSLGITGLRESVDIKMEGEISNQELMERLNDALPDDIVIYDITEPVMKPGKIAFASFEILLEPEDVTPDELARIITVLFQSPEIIVSKRSKAGAREINLKPYLSRVKVQVEGDKVRLSAILPAGSTENINPSLLLTAMETYLSCRFYTDITRTNLYDADMQAFA